MDLPGSVVDLGLQREAGKVDVVRLRRMANAVIADKRSIFELFTKSMDRAKKNKDHDAEKYLQQALELWTQEMLEQHEHDTICMENVQSMQESTDAWLQELLELLQGKGGIQKQAKAQPSNSTPLASISQADYDKLRGLLAEKNSNVEDLKKKLQVATDLAKNLKQKVDEDRVMLDKIQTDLADRDRLVIDLKEQLSKIIYHKDNEIDAKDSDLAARNMEIDELKKRLAALQNALERDEAELKVDRAHLQQDEKLICDKDAEISELKRKLAALEKSSEVNHTPSDTRTSQILCAHMTGAWRHVLRQDPCQYSFCAGFDFWFRK